MESVHARDEARPAAGWPAFLAGLSGPSVGTAVGVALAAAVMLNPAFTPPFVVLLGRMLFLAMAMLLVFAAARAWPGAWGLRRLPRWLAPLIAVVLAAPLVTLAIYLFTTGGDFASFIGAPARVVGFVLIAGSGIVLSLITIAAATMRERLAQARAQALQFELERSRFELERSRLEKQALDVRLSLLQAQIEPHFLFNTLANVQALVESRSPRAPEVLKSLIAYLRAALPRLKDEQPTLANELALVRAYMALMQMRMPDRLQYREEVDEAMLGLRFPPMALLTLVENAVRHGIDPGEDGGEIVVGGRLEAARCRLWVADTGLGMSEQAEPGTGLTNLRDRLAATFGPAAALQLSVSQPHGLHAEIAWPR